VSIIYSTLEHLEIDESAQRDAPAATQDTGATERTRGGTLRAAGLLLLGGTGLILWQFNDTANTPLPVASSIAATGSERYGPGTSAPPAAATAEPPAVPDAKSDTGRTEAEAPGTTGARIQSRDATVAPAASEPPSTVAAPTAALAPQAEPTVRASASLATERVPAAGQAAVSEPEPEGPAGTATVSEAAAADTDRIIENARLALSRASFAEVLATLDALQPPPGKRADFWLLKGSAHLGLDQLDVAERAFDSAWAIAPDNAQIAVQRAIVQQERDAHAIALKILTAAAISHPEVPEIYLNQGYSEQVLGAHRAAERSFRQFLLLTEGRSLYARQRQLVQSWLAQTPH
jgi:hypothetical protein